MDGDRVAAPVPELPAPPMPTGTLTFLLTDIECSARLWERHPGGEAAAAVRRYNQLLDAVVARHAGRRPVGPGEGDSVLAVFVRAADAVAAALDAQRTLAAERWPTAEPLRVRMAIHTGDAQLRDDGGYAGPVLSRCARLRDIGDGGQVLLSRASRDLVCDHLPGSAGLLDLGLHYLRDLDRPEHVFQLCHPELPAAFPRLQSSDRSRTNLPHQLTSFVGRERELDELPQLLRRYRLVSLTGAGGCGKTRLALEVAARLLDDFADGVWWADLAVLSDADLLPGAVASTMRVQETPGVPLTDVLAGVLASRRTLIVLDNCEHVIDACTALCRALLQASPGLAVLATSREPLGLDGETIWRVPSLAVADETAPTARLTDCEAARLFIDRATHARPMSRVSDEDARTVVQICRRLDGIPLAIELAAARTRMLTLEQIAAGLDDRFRLLVSGRRSTLSRQRTLEASVDWSYGLLDDDQRALLRRLSVFAGSFDIEAAEAVCAGDGPGPDRVVDLLLQLVDRSLVQPQDSPSRYRLLETIRQYGWQKALNAGEVEVLRDRHLDYYASVAATASPLLEVGATAAWLERLDLELDNLRAAMDWGATGGSPEKGLRLAIGAAIYWETRAHFAEARARMAELLERGNPDDRLRAQALVALELMALDGADVDAVVSYADQALDLARAVGDVGLEARALTYRGGMMALAEPAAAIPWLTQGRRRALEAGDLYCVHWAGQFLGAAHQQVGDLATARRILDETVTTTGAVGDAYNHSGALYWRGMCHLEAGRLDEAERDFREGCELASLLQDFTGRMFWVMLGLTLGLAGRHDDARALIEGTVQEARETRNDLTLACGLVCVASIGRATADPDAAAAAADEAAQLYGAMGIRGWLAPHAHALLGWAELTRGHLDRSQAALEEGLALAAGPLAAGWALVGQALLARVRGEVLQAEDLVRGWLAEVGEESIVVADALEILGGALADVGEHADAARFFGAGDAVRRRSGVVRWGADEPGYRADLELVREAIGGEAFAVAWEKGAALSTGEAVAFATRGRGRRGRPTKGWDSLTPTELEVARLVAQGLTNPQIGQRLFVTRGTVKTHVAHVFTKLGVSTRAELASEATRRGF